MELPSVPARINTVIYSENKLQYFFLRGERAHLEAFPSHSVFLPSFGFSRGVEPLPRCKMQSSFSFLEILTFYESKL